MTGKKTFSGKLHPSRQGALVPSLPLGGGDWRAIEAAIGALTNDERAAIQNQFDLVSMMAGEKVTNNAEIRATLTAMARPRASDAKVLQAFEHCDENTRAIIDRELYRLDGPDFWRYSPRPVKLRIAAEQALTQLRPKKGGKGGGPKPKGWQRALARYALGLCIARGLSAAISHGEKNSPAVDLMMALFGAMDVETPTNPSGAAKLLSEIRGELLPNPHRD